MTIDIKKNNVWIYGFGAAGKWVSDNINSNVKGFIDSGSAKRSQKYKNLSVYSPEAIQNLIKPDDLILVTVLDIQDVIPVIENKFINIKWSALGEFITNQKTDLNLTDDSDDFIEYTLKAVELCHKSFLNKDNKFLHSVDIVISEKCTLNCRWGGGCGGPSLLGVDFHFQLKNDLRPLTLPERSFPTPRRRRKS